MFVLRILRVLQPGRNHFRTAVLASYPAIFPSPTVVRWEPLDQVPLFLRVLVDYFTIVVRVRVPRWFSFGSRLLLSASVVGDTCQSGSVVNAYLRDA